MYMIMGLFDDPHGLASTESYGDIFVMVCTDIKQADIMVMNK